VISSRRTQFLDRGLRGTPSACFGTFLYKVVTGDPAVQPRPKMLLANRKQSESSRGEGELHMTLGLIHTSRHADGRQPKRAGAHRRTYVDHLVTTPLTPSRTRAHLLERPEYPRSRGRSGSPHIQPAGNVSVVRFVRYVLFPTDRVLLSSLLMFISTRQQMKTRMRGLHGYICRVNAIHCPRQHTHS
jgi:hypothetical protein